MQLTHWAQLVVPSHGDGSPDELLADDADTLEFDVDKPEPPWPPRPDPPLPTGSTTTLAPQAARYIVRAPNNIEEASFLIIDAELSRAKAHTRASGRIRLSARHFPNAIDGASHETWRRRLAVSWILPHWMHVPNREEGTRSRSPLRGLARKSSCRFRHESYVRVVTAADVMDAVAAEDTAFMATSRLVRYA